MGCAGLLLYLLDVTLRMAQQVQPVRITRVDACPSATLATLEFNTDPYTPVMPVQVFWHTMLYSLQCLNMPKEKQSQPSYLCVLVCHSRA